MSLTKYQEYLICKERGHQSNGQYAGHEYATWSHCQWCGTKFWTTTETTLHEENVPFDGAAQKEEHDG